MTSERVLKATRRLVVAEVLLLALAAATPSAVEPGCFFIRGEATGDTLVTVSDPVRTLRYLFSGASSRSICARNCRDRARARS